MGEKYVYPLSKINEKQGIKKKELNPMVKEFQIIYPRGGYQVNSYLLTCPQTKKTAIIDLGGEANKVLKYLNDKELKLEYVIITHLHGDHVEGVEELQKKLKESVPVYSFTASPVTTKFLKDENSLKLGELGIKVIHTPGHSPDSICLYVNGVLFAGDSLDIHCGKGMVTETIKYLERAKVPGDTKCYRGHETVSTLDNIKKELK
jgi:glyoxylase-like metal-dependent hydrolase (beta-lactamase superfamily II)